MFCYILLQGSFVRRAVEPLPRSKRSVSLAMAAPTAPAEAADGAVYASKFVPEGTEATAEASQTQVWTSGSYPTLLSFMEHHMIGGAAESLGQPFSESWRRSQCCRGGQTCAFHHTRRPKLESGDGTESNTGASEEQDQKAPEAAP